MKKLFASVLAALSLAPAVALADAHGMKAVQVTPLGGQDGEFCRLDRAMIFEDPNGTRILYDAGRTVAGADDPRLGDIDIVLLSHVHGDHFGDKHTSAPNAGSCGKPDMSVTAVPSANTVNIAVAKDAILLTGSEMPNFMAAKIIEAGGNPKKSQLVRFGAMKTINDIGITTVPATHSNGLGGAFISGPLGEMLSAASLTAYVGPPTGYVINFSNGLVVYLSGDTGMTAEQKDLIGDHYGAELVVMNIGNTFTTGPKEAAYVVNEMIKPASVIASHANEEATRDGKVIAGTRTELFSQLANMPVHLPLSGNTMSFDDNGTCVKGCN
jgi:L-ascorbate metabolism protein UlaG (beta-lactamase superfamily)